MMMMKIMTNSKVYPRSVCLWCLVCHTHTHTHTHTRHSPGMKEKKTLEQTDRIRKYLVRYNTTL